MNLRAATEDDLLKLRGKISDELNRRRSLARAAVTSAQAYVQKMAHCPVLPNSVEELIKRVCDERGLNMHSVLGPSHTRPLAYARFEIWAELRKRDFSYPRIGIWFGRDHSTIISGVEKHNRLLADQVVEVAA